MLSAYLINQPMLKGLSPIFISLLQWGQQRSDKWVAGSLHLTAYRHSIGTCLADKVIGTGIDYPSVS